MSSDDNWIRNIMTMSDDYSSLLIQNAQLFYSRHQMRNLIICTIPSRESFISWISSCANGDDKPRVEEYQTFVASLSDDRFLYRSYCFQYSDAEMSHFLALAAVATGRIAVDNGRRS